MVKSKGFTVILDQRELTPGEKFYYWEKKGIPIRLEIGLQEMKKETVTIVQRHTLLRNEVQLENLVREIKEALDEIDRDLLSRAGSLLKEKIGLVSNLADVSEAVQKGLPVLGTPFCGGERCRLLIEERSAMEIIGFSIKRDAIKQKCLVCEKEAKQIAYLARTY